MRQVRRTVQHQHVAARLQRVDCIPRSLHQENVTGAQADCIQVTGNLRTARTGAMNSQGQQSEARTESSGGKRAQMKRRSACHDNLRELLTFSL